MLLRDARGKVSGYVAVNRDITERKRAEQESETMMAFLKLMNDCKGTADLVHSALSFFRERSGFEAVGIRLKDGDDYPYFEASGFTEEFMRMENSLCVQNTYGQLYSDNNGYPIHECMCGNVICGRFDPSKPFFTARGSFCTNSTTELLATTTDADQQTRTRNRCNGEGYESMALIALRVSEKCFGLLQLNDRRKRQFSPETISMWEQLADYLAVALAKTLAEDALCEVHKKLQMQSEELQVQSEEIQVQNEELRAQSEELGEAYKTLQESEARFRSVLDNSRDVIYRVNAQTGHYEYISQSAEKVTGFTLDEFMAIDAETELAMIHPDDLPAMREAVARLEDIGKAEAECRQRNKSGDYRWISSHMSLTMGSTGRPLYRNGNIWDITERKQTEKALRENEARLETIFTAIPNVILEYDTNLRPIKANVAALKVAGLTSLDFTRDQAVAKLKFKNLDGSEVRPETLPTSRALRGEIVAGDLYSITTADGTEQIISAFTAPFYKDDKINGVVALWHDITELKRAEDTLRESEERYRALFDNSIDAIFLTSPDGTVHAANSEACRIFRMTKEEIIRTGRSGVVDRSDPRLQPALEERARTGKFKGELNYRRKDGTIFPGEVSTAFFNDRNGLVKTSMIIRDITERKQMEEALKKAHDTLEEKVKERTAELERAYNLLTESEEKYRNIVETANEGIWTSDAEYRTTYVNKKLAEMLGYSPEETIGKLGLDFVDEKYKSISIQDRERKLLGIDNTHENKLIHKDGSLLWVLVNSKAFFDKDGKFTGLLAMFTDITERKKAEEKIQNLANIVESSNDAIITKSLDGIITSWNKGAEQVYGYSAKEIIGKPMYILSPSRSDEETNKLIEKVKKGEGTQQYETSRLRKDGTIIHVSISLSPVFDSSGKLIAVSVTARDITKSKKAEEALAKIEIVRKQEIHHRIKNNLQVISSLLDLQAETFNGNECIQDSEVLEAFRESQDRVISMALIHEELYKGGGFETLNFSPYIKKLIDSLFNTYKVGNIDINLNVDLVENAFFDMDTAVPLGIIVNELVSNSFKHAFKGRDRGEIQIKLHREESEDCESASFILTVSDNGVGIPENLEIEDLNSLGMQLVTTLVDQLDGELELKRNNGTEFAMRLIVQ